MEVRCGCAVEVVVVKVLEYRSKKFSLYNDAYLFVKSVVMASAAVSVCNALFLCEYLTVYPSTVSTYLLLLHTCVHDIWIVFSM
jgi:hypothetical protein